MKYFFVYLVLFCLVLNSCKEDPPSVVENDFPPLTNTGQNTFACYLNGEPFVAYMPFTIGGSYALDGSFNEISKLFKIQGTRKDENDHIDRVVFKGYVDNGVGIYEMDVVTDHYKGYDDYSGENCYYYHDTLNRGTFEITFLDLNAHIISGTFAMNLINNDCSLLLLKVTDGRFDFLY